MRLSRVSLERVISGSLFQLNRSSYEKRITRSGSAIFERCCIPSPKNRSRLEFRQVQQGFSVRRSRHRYQGTSPLISPLHGSGSWKREIGDTEPISVISGNLQTHLLRT